MENKAKETTKRHLNDEITLFGMKLSLGVDIKLAKWAAVLFGEVLVILLVIFLVLIPKWEELSVLRSKLGKEQNNLQELNKKNEALSDFDVSIAPRYGFMDKEAFLSEKDLGQMLASLGQLALKANVQIIKYSLKPGTVYDSNAKGASKTEEMGIDLSVGGNSTAVTSFLALLDTSIPLKEIKNLTIKAVSGSDGQAFELGLDLSFFELPINKSVQADSPLKMISEDDLSFAGRLEGFTRYSAEATESGSVSTGNNNLFGQ